MAERLKLEKLESIIDPGLLLKSAVPNSQKLRRSFLVFSIFASSFYFWQNISFRPVAGEGQSIWADSEILVDELKWKFGL